MAASDARPRVGAATRASARAGHSGPSARPHRGAPPRRAAAGGVDPVLLRRGRRRHRRRRAHHAVRDSRSRRRPARAGARPGDADGAGLVRRPRATAGHDRGRLRTDRTGARAKRSSRRRSATTPRCSASAALRDADNRDAARSLPARRRRHPGRRVLPPAGRRRTRPRPRLLARVSRDRPRRGDQSRTLRSLSHARRRHARSPRAAAPTSRSIRGTTTRSWPIC